MKIIMLTEDERKRMLELVSRPCPPGPAKELDVKLMRRLG
jgi:hypothetical protein